MVKIPIKVGKKDYELRSDEKNWVFGRLNTGKEGKNKGIVSFVAESFFSDLSGAMRGILERKLKASDISSIEELQMEIRKGTEELKGLYETNVI